MAEGDGGEAHEDRRPRSRILQEARLGVARHALVNLKEAVGAGAAGVNDAFGNALVIEVGDLLAEMKIFEEGRSAFARF